jgi:hypothetical protein
MSEFQSNRPFLTPKFNPRLVRYGLPPVFPTMPLQESRRLWFVLEGDPESKPYDIFDIALGSNITRLKEAIQRRARCLCDSDIEADCLKLRKVVSLIPMDYLNVLTFAFSSTRPFL